MKAIGSNTLEIPKGVFWRARSRVTGKKWGRDQDYICVPLVCVLACGLGFTVQI